MVLTWMALACVAVACGAAAVYAQERSSSGLTALEIPTGARPLGMGRAFVATAGDLQGLFYNPAGLAGRDSIGVTLSRYQGSSDLDVNGNFGAASFPVLSGSASVAVSYEDLGEFELTGSTPEPLGSRDLRNLLLVGSYAAELRPEVSLGASVKYLDSDLGAASGSGVAFDAGVLVRPVPRIPLAIGVAALNVGPDVTFELDETDGGTVEGEGDKLPSRLRYGLWIDAGELTKDEGLPDEEESDYGLKLAADVEHDIREFAEVSFFGGAALDYREIVVLRGGVLRLANAFGGESPTGASLGAGIQWKGLRVDVARELGVNEVGDETHFSVGADF